MQILALYRSRFGFSSNFELNTLFLVGRVLCHVDNSYHCVKCLYLGYLNTEIYFINFRIQMWENTGQKNSESGHFLRSV